MSSIASNDFSINVSSSIRLNLHNIAKSKIASVIHNLQFLQSFTTMRVSSLHYIVQDNSVACTREEVEEIFSSADKNKSGQLNIRQG